MGQLIPPTTSISISTTSVQGMLTTIRPHWKAKSLIQRVEKLLPVDPSSACQRLLNAAFHDLRDKVIIAGLDIAKQAADIHKLPPVSKAEDVENYSNDRIIDLAYRMGLLDRGAWRRIKRCYEIRRDLEHEDDEYQAELQDCFYIFSTCIEDVLSQDPVQLLRVKDVKDVVEQPKPQFPEQQFLDDFRIAPDPRQKEIMFFLVFTALDASKPDIIRSNSFEMIKHLRNATRDAVKIEVGQHMQNRVGRNVADFAVMKVSHGAGVASYLKKNCRNDFFTEVGKRLNQIGYEWRKYEIHSQILAELEDVGGLEHCDSDDVAKGILRWLILCYVGEPGGVTRYGHRRDVFYSDSASSIIKRLVQRSGARELAIIKDLQTDREVKAALSRSRAVAQRFEDIVDIAGDK